VLTHQALRAVHCGACRRQTLLLISALLASPAAAADAIDAVAGAAVELSSLPFAELEALAKASYRRRELEAALDALSELARREPAEALWRERRAQVLLDLKRFADSVREFDAAAALQPESYVSLGLLSNRALALEGLGKLAEADADYSRAVDVATSLGAELPYVLNSRGNVRGAMGRWEEALADYTAAADSFRRARNVNGVSYALSNAALVEAQLGMPVAAAHIATAARRGPGSVDMRVAQAALQWDAGDGAAAEASWEFACSGIYTGQVLDGKEGLGGPVCAPRLGLCRSDCLRAAHRQLSALPRRRLGEAHPQVRCSAPAGNSARFDSRPAFLCRWPPVMADKLAAFFSLRRLTPSG